MSAPLPFEAAPQAQRNQPDPLLKEYVDPRIPLFLPELPGLAVEPSIALGLDPGQPGWVPSWYPWTDTEGQMTPEQRASAFHKQLEENLPDTSGEPDLPSTRKRSAALSLLHLHSSLKNGALPTPAR